MSLSIEVYNADQPSAPAVWSRPFGVEATRNSVWGSQAARALGLTWLPRLAEEAFIEAQDEDLAALEREARLTLARLTEFVFEAGEREYVRARLEFLIEACSLARTLGVAGTVCVG